jgi:hypothetical protein
MRGIDGIRSTPLGVEPKGEGIQGQSGYSIGGATQHAPEAKPEAQEKTTKPVAPAALPSTTSAISFLPPAMRELMTPAPRAAQSNLNAELPPVPQR